MADGGQYFVKQSRQIGVRRQLHTHVVQPPQVDKLPCHLRLGVLQQRLRITKLPSGRRELATHPLAFSWAHATRPRFRVVSPHPSLPRNEVMQSCEKNGEAE